MSDWKPYPPAGDKRPPNGAPPEPQLFDTGPLRIPGLPQAPQPTVPMAAVPQQSFPLALAPTAPIGSQQGAPYPGAPYPIAPYPSYPGAPYPAYPGAYPIARPPQEYKLAGVLMLISGIKNALLSLVWIFSLIWVCVGAFWFITLAGAIGEIVVGAMILGARVTPHGKTMAILGIINSALCFNVIGLGMEIVALVQLNRPDVQRYIAQNTR